MASTGSGSGRSSQQGIGANASGTTAPRGQHNTRAYQRAIMQGMRENGTIPSRARQTTVSR